MFIFDIEGFRIEIDFIFGDILSCLLGIELMDNN